MTLKMWYSEGLRFKCTGCGGCCTGFPGNVWVTEEEIAAIEKESGLPRERFIHYVGGRPSLTEDPVSYDCVFLKGKRCSIYPARPNQCRTYPWWLSQLQSEEEWNEAAKVCEGINHPEAPLVSANEIDALSDFTM